MSEPDPNVQKRPDKDEQRALQTYIRVLGHELDRRKSHSIGFLLIEVLPPTIIIGFFLGCILSCSMGKWLYDPGWWAFAAFLSGFVVVCPVVYLIAKAQRKGYVARLRRQNQWDYMLNDVEGEEVSVEELEQKRKEARIRLYGDLGHAAPTWPQRLLGGLSIADDDHARGAISQAEHKEDDDEDKELK